MHRTAGPDQPAVLRSLSWSPEDQDGPGRRRPEADRDRSVRRDQNGPDARTTTRPWDHGTWPAARRATGGSGPRGRPEAGRGGEASITAGVAQRRSHGLQRGLERPGAHAQRRAGRACRQRVSRPGVRRVGRPARTASGPSTAVRRGSRRRGRLQVVRPIPRASGAGGTGRARLRGPAAAARRSRAGGRARGRRRVRRRGCRRCRAAVRADGHRRRRASPGSAMHPQLGEVLGVQAGRDGLDELPGDEHVDVTYSARRGRPARLGLAHLEPLGTGRTLTHADGRDDRRELDCVA